MDLLTVGCDAAIVVLTILASWYSYKLIKATGTAGAQFGWWTILPAVMVYAAIIRTITLLCAMGLICDDIQDIMVIAMFVFWAGITVFLFGMCKATHEIIKRNGNCK